MPLCCKSNYVYENKKIFSSKKFFQAWLKEGGGSFSVKIVVKNKMFLLTNKKCSGQAYSHSPSTRELIGWSKLNKNSCEKTDY